jgi:parallel beta-helix repeat protein
MDMRAYVATGALVAMLGGCEGDTGLMGSRGDRGEPGAPGQPGAPGDDGEDGAPGQPGAPADVPTCGPVAPSVDGSDATAAIQDCIDEMGRAGGGTVVLRAGTYVLRTNHLRFAAGQHDRVRLRGAGALTVLEIDGATSGILVGSDATDLSECGSPGDGENTPIAILEGVSIDGVTIVGNLSETPEDCCQLGSSEFEACTQYTDSSLTRDGIAVRCAAGVRITNVAIENASNAGISVEQVQGLIVDGARIDGPLVACVASAFADEVDFPTERVTIRNVACNVPGLAGLQLATMTGLTLQDSAVFDAGQLFQCEVGEGERWEKPGIVLDFTRDSTIADNLVTGSTGRGIELIASSRNIISQNHVTDNNQSGIALDTDGECGPGSNNNLLSGNIVANGSDNSIFAACPSFGNAASTNICSGNDDDSIRVVANCECNSEDVLAVVAGPCDFPRGGDPGSR